MVDHTKSLRPDLQLISDMVTPGTRVLDVGCGEGELLEHLAQEKNADARGVELSQKGVNSCVARGLSVVQGDADTDLVNYPDGAFDLAILSKTLQATRQPDQVLRQLLRIADKAIVSIPNFGHWRVRLSLMATGRMPMTSTLDVPWYQTPNIHFCTIRDFVLLCNKLDIVIERTLPVTAAGHKPVVSALPYANFFAEQGLFLLRAPNGVTAQPE